MTLRASRVLIHLSLLFALISLTRGAWAAGMETVKIAPDKEGFILDPSGDRYIPWGWGVENRQVKSVFWDCLLSRFLFRYIIVTRRTRDWPTGRASWEE
jgi:hypothetical protein